MNLIDNPDLDSSAAQSSILNQSSISEV